MSSQSSDPPGVATTRLRAIESPVSSGGTGRRRRGGQLLVLPVLLGHDLLGGGEQCPRLPRDRCCASDAVAQLVVGVVLERDRRPRRVQPERVLADRAHGRVEAEQRPVAAGGREVLLLHAVAQVEAVRDAVAVGEDQRGSRIGLRFAECEQRVLRVGAHRHLRDVDVAVGDRLQRQVLARHALAGGGELGDRAERRRLGRLTAGVGIDLGVEHQHVDVAAARQHVVEPAIADVVGPAVAADDPDAAPDQVVDHRQQIACGLARRCAASLSFSARDAGALRADLGLADLRRREDRSARSSPTSGASCAQQRARQLQVLVGRQAKAQAELGVVLEQRVRPGRARGPRRPSSTASPAGCRRRSTSSRWRWRSAGGRRTAATAASDTASRRSRRRRRRTRTAAAGTARRARWRNRPARGR